MVLELKSLVTDDSTVPIGQDNVLLLSTWNAKVDALASPPNVLTISPLGVCQNMRAKS